MKTITVRDKHNNPYVLTYTAETIKMIEAKGFVLEQITEKPMTMIPMLFEGAFLAKEGGKVTSDEAMEMFLDQDDKQGLLAKLIELYNDPLNEVIVKSGNMKWEANF